MRTFTLLTALLLHCSAFAGGIVGGTPTRAPWVVHFTQAGINHCSGTLLAPRWIITAAHCFYQQTFMPETMLLGAGGDGTQSTLQLLPAIDGVFIHPDYAGPQTTEHDIALVHLAAPVTLGKDIQSLPLRDISSAQLGQLKAEIAGWGKRDIDGTAARELHSIVVPFHRTTTAPVSKPLKAIIAQHFSAPGILVFENSTNITCGGDSGAGWTVELEGKGRFLMAVHSAGDCRNFGIGVELSSKISWIKRFLAYP